MDKLYNIILDHDTRIFVSFNVYNKNISSFIIKLLYLANNEWHEVRRFDTAHNSVHEDILNLAGQKVRKVIYYQLDNQSGLNFAIDKYKDHYREYIKEYIK
jgi:hypothetical protein